MWLYQQGHTVLGVEGVPFVVEQFFRESKLEFDKVAMPQINGWRFRTKDGRLTVYACDFFLMTPELMGPVDAVYDGGRSRLSTRRRGPPTSGSSSPYSDQTSGQGLIVRCFRFTKALEDAPA
jgi:hypothetical protein